VIYGVNVIGLVRGCTGGTRPTDAALVNHIDPHHPDSRAIAS